MKLGELMRGLPGHPSHPPLTDATIGIYTFVAVAALLNVLGFLEEEASVSWSLAIIVGLIASAPTAFTGLLDWAKISSGTPLWRTATLHLAVMVTATVLFIVAAVLGYGDASDGDLPQTAAILTFIAFGVLTIGGWLGGTIVYVHGMRVLNLVDEPAHRAAAPVPTPEKRSAEEE